jgi:hypothetical protein
MGSFCAQTDRLIMQQKNNFLIVFVVFAIGCKVASFSIKIPPQSITFVEK